MEKAMKNVLKAALYFAAYVVLAYAAMVPGYASPIYWMLFPIAASFLMTGPLTCTMSLIRKPGGAMLLPILFFLLAKVLGELKFSVCWIPFLCIALLAEILRNVTGTENIRSIRIAVPTAMLSMAMWNNGFYFGGQAYMDAAAADMGEAYTAAAYQMSTAVTYIVVLAGVFLASCLSERLTEKIAKIR